MDLSGRRVLVTGGGSGVGAALARAFADAGAQVTLAGRRAEPLQAVAGARMRAIPTDVTDEAAVDALFEAAGPQDVVIANAGVAESAPLRKTALADWQRHLTVNLTGTFLTFRAGLRAMGQGGRLIAVASTAGLKGYPYVAAYTASKHGVVGLVRALALETATKGITVNAICPGFLDTEMTDASVRRIAETTGSDAETARARLAATNPQKRLIDPGEVAAAALWLCGPGSEGVNGQAIAISGGEV